MIRGLLAKILIILLTYSAWGQNLRFRTHYNFGSTAGGYVSTDIFQIGNDFILAGFLQNSSLGYPTNALGIIRTDSAGVQKWQKIIKSPNGNGFYNNTARFYLKLKDNNLLFTGMFSRGSYHSSGCLAKISSETGDTLWTRQYTQVGDSSILFCSAELQDSNIISMGYRYYEVNGFNHKRTFMLKTDKNGNYLWHKFILPNSAVAWTIISKLYNINDKDFLMVGGYNYSNDRPKGFIIKFDTNNVISYNKLITHPSYTYTAVEDVKKLNDGSILVCGGVITDHSWNFSYESWRPWLYKFDLMTGNKIDSRLYDSTKLHANLFHSIYQDPVTNNIYTTGIEYMLNSGFDLSFYKFAPNLDSLHSRFFHYEYGGTYFASRLERTFDSGFALALQMYPTNVSSQFCLIRTDTLGCDSAAECTYTEPVSVKENSFDVGLFLSAFPNPASGAVTINYKLPFRFSRSELVITDITGREIYRTELEALQNKVSIKTSNWASGMYYYSLYSGSAHMETKPLIITK